MTILQILEKLTGGKTGLIDLLVALGNAAPDTKPKADEWIAALNSAADEGNLVVVAALLPGEIANVLKGKIDPRDHPSDVI